jgi:uncharacterized membrane protein YbhN (UPF0104 family)
MVLFAFGMGDLDTPERSFFKEGLKVERTRWFILKGRPILSSLVVIVIFYFLGKYFFHHYHELSQYHWEIRYPFFVGSFIFLFGNYVLEAWIWKKLLEMFNISIPISKCFRIISLSQLGKYIPGKFWIYLGQFYLGGREGIPKGVILLSNFFLLILLTIGGMTLFNISYLLWPSVNKKLALGLWVLIALALIIIHPGLFKRGVEIFRRWTGTSLRRSSYAKVLFLFFVVLLDWFVYLIGFYFFLQSFYPVTLRELIIYSGIFAISGLLGFYSLITPGGLGVREGFQAYLMSMFIPVSIAIFISIFSRIWMTLAEVGAAFVSLRIK